MTIIKYNVSFDVSLRNDLIVNYSTDVVHIFIHYCELFSVSFTVSVKERARFSFLGRSDGPLSTASLRPDLLLPVPKPAAIFVGLRDLGEHQLFSRPRAV